MEPSTTSTPNKGTPNHDSTTTFNSKSDRSLALDPADVQLAFTTDPHPEATSNPISNHTPSSPTNPTDEPPGNTAKSKGIGIDIDIECNEYNTLNILFSLSLFL